MISYDLIKDAVDLTLGIAMIHIKFVRKIVITSDLIFIYLHDNFANGNIIAFPPPEFPNPVSEIYYKARKLGANIVHIVVQKKNSKVKFWLRLARDRNGG